MEFVIRNCIKSDIDNLVKLCEEHAEYEKIPYALEEKNIRLCQALFSDSKRVYCLVVESEGTLVGYATYTFDYSTWDAGEFVNLDCLYLQQEYRNLGIGQILFDKIRYAGKEKGCVSMQWHTPNFNEGAIKFYQRNGALGRLKMRFSLLY
ncbi:GNAT family N-acetyltransferase [Sphingobacterium tabacisoli]|uniref:GNAT family N-acetyltransferase n=1 Tax=Sphingobacterium tabacisoli TaxID=2044855 RepID=A0ABW5L804_9SPHI|nr:GNAT family N-acetyltransferase [Sphingobacterium tabacisoli]